jgi:Ala-tRNA(Pro) deacylase
MQPWLDYLDRNRIRYQRLTETPRKIAKCIVFAADENYGMAVVPAGGYANLDELRTILGAQKVRVADEGELRRQFPDFEVGAMPPFGDLFGMKVFVECSLTLDDTIAFRAGTHDEVVQMSFEDYRALVHPVIADLRRWGTPDCPEESYNSSLPR